MYREASPQSFCSVCDAACTLACARCRVPLCADHRLSGYDACEPCHDIVQAAVDKSDRRLTPGEAIAATLGSAGSAAFVVLGALGASLAGAVAGACALIGWYMTPMMSTIGRYKRTERVIRKAITRGT